MPVLPLVPVLLHLMLVAIACGALPVAASEAEPTDEEAAYLAELSALVTAEARASLQRIEGTGRRWLALRAYLRAGSSLKSRWSWTQAQLEEFEQTREHAALVEAVRTVQRRFAAANPGYVLVANTTARSLDTQLERWNENATVAAGAEALRLAVRDELSRTSYPPVPTPTARERLAQFLAAWTPPHAIALAAPGLSLHGQLRAIDFAVFKQGRIVASTTVASVASVWHGQGWTQRLEQATAGAGFIGPLRIPDEPWHYEYRPDHLPSPSVAASN